MSKTVISSENIKDWVSSLLNLDISALQTTNIAQCREPIWELRHTHNKSNHTIHTLSDNLDPCWGSPASLLYCVERLFNCLSEEAQRVISQGIDKHTPLEIE